MDYNKVKELIDDVLESSCFDMQDEFENEEIAEIALAVLRQATTYQTSYVYITDEHAVKTSRLFADRDETQYFLKISNKRSGSFISWNGENGTGLSESLCYVINPDTEVERYDIDEMVTMINEAWYLYSEN